MNRNDYSPAHSLDAAMSSCATNNLGEFVVCRSLTIAQAMALLAELPPLARTMLGLALSSGVGRGELFCTKTSTSNVSA